MPETTSKIWLITGCSTGLGRTLAETLLAAGRTVVATARNPDQLAALAGDRTLILPLDVTDPSSVDSAVAAAIGRFGRIDVLVNNAGYGLVGAMEEPTDDDIRQQYETNVFGLLRVTRAVLPHMRRQRSGHILNLSSIGGLIATPGLGYYNSTKFAVNGLSEALAGEVAPLGINVTLVEPGPFRTDFLGRSGVMARQQLDDYKPTAGRARQYFEDNHGKQLGDPVRAAQAMMAAVESSDPPKHLLLGKSAWDRWSARLDQWRQDLAAGRETAFAADFPEGE